MATQWVEITVTVPLEHGEAVACFLVDHGAPGLRVHEDGASASFIAYYAHDAPLAALRRLCADLAGSVDDPYTVRIGSRIVEDQDWAENWKLDFAPQLVGARLYVCPPWHRMPPPGRVAVIIDPGMAFGTGHHPSTRGCLQLLEEIIAMHQVLRALDVGTGSGVLAIALAKLGVADVWAIDNDPNARAISVVNAEVNHVDRALHVAAHAEDVPGTFDVVVANLFVNLLEDFAPQLARWVHPHGTLICSGLLTVDEPRVRSAYDTLGFDGVARLSEDSWVTLALRRKD